MQKTVLIIILCSLFSFYLDAQDSNQLFVKGNELAAAKSYQQSVETYQQLLETGVQSAEVEFNLANSLLALNRIGEAVLHYERAARLAPNDEEIQQNLRLARERIEDNIPPRQRFFLSEMWTGIQTSASSGIWSFLTLLSFWGGIACMIIWQTGKTRSNRKKGFFAGVSLLSLSLIFFFLGKGKAALEIDSKAGIIVAEKIELRQAADADSPVLREIPEGIKVSISDVINDWYKIELPNGEEGWLAASDFEII